MVSDKKWATNLTEDSSYTMNAFSWLLSRFSPWLSFGGLIILCLFVALFEFILFEVHWAFWMCRVMFFIWWKCSSSILPAAFSLLLWRRLYVYMLVHLMVSRKALRFIHSSFLFLRPKVSIGLSPHTFLPAQICFRARRVIYFRYYSFELHNFYLFPFYNFCFFLVFSIRWDIILTVPLALWTYFKWQIKSLYLVSLTSGLPQGQLLVIDFFPPRYFPHFFMHAL